MGIADLGRNQRDRRSRRLVVLLAVPFILVMLAVGDRGGPIATMGVIASGLYLVGSRIGLWRSLAVVALIAFLIPTILNLRQMPISEVSGSTLANAATNQVQAANTFGDDPSRASSFPCRVSIRRLWRWLLRFPDIEGYHLGGDYLASLAVAVPFRSIIFPFFGADLSAVHPAKRTLQKTWVPGAAQVLGSLQLAEAYLQFGAIGVVGLYLIFGWGLTRLWRSMTSKATCPRALAFASLIVMETLLWVRNSSTSGV